MYAVNQEKLPSVTSILQATQSEEKKASLANWKARVGAAEANRIKNEASSRGTSMHSHLEKYLLGQLNLELLEEEASKSKKMADEIIEQGIKGKLSEIYGTEATLYHPGKYAHGVSRVDSIKSTWPCASMRNSWQAQRKELSRPISGQSAATRRRCGSGKDPNGT